MGRQDNCPDGRHDNRLEARHHDRPDGRHDDRQEGGHDNHLDRPVQLQFAITITSLIMFKDYACLTMTQFRDCMMRHAMRFIFGNLNHFDIPIAGAKRARRAPLKALATRKVA